MSTNPIQINIETAVTQMYTEHTVALSTVVCSSAAVQINKYIHAHKIEITQQPDPPTADSQAVSGSNRRIDTTSPYCVTKNNDKPR